MTNDATEQVTVLLLRDGEGHVYMIDEQTIRNCRATPEQQAAVVEALGNEDVTGFNGPGGFSPVGSINIVAAPQININTGINLAVLSPNATQVLGQSGNNSLFAFQ
jgi:hypothetical protein